MVAGRVRYGGIAQPAHSTEDPVTEDGMALVELLQKSGDAGFLRSLAERVLHLPMETDVEGLIGAARHERSAERLNLLIPTEVARDSGMISPTIPI